MKIIHFYTYMNEASRGINGEGSIQGNTENTAASSTDIQRRDIPPREAYIHESKEVQDAHLLRLQETFLDVIREGRALNDNAMKGATQSPESIVMASERRLELLGMFHEREMAKRFLDWTISKEEDGSLLNIRHITEFGPKNKIPKVDLYMTGERDQDGRYTLKRIMMDDQDTRAFAKLRLRLLNELKSRKYTNSGEGNYDASISVLNGEDDYELLKIKNEAILKLAGLLPIADATELQHLFDWARTFDIPVVTEVKLREIINSTHTSTPLSGGGQ